MAEEGEARAATMIQKAVKMWLAKTEFSKRKAKKKQYDKMMEKLQKEVRGAKLGESGASEAVIRSNKAQQANNASIGILSALSTLSTFSTFSTPSTPSTFSNVIVGLS